MRLLLLLPLLAAPSPATLTGSRCGVTLQTTGLASAHHARVADHNCHLISAPKGELAVGELAVLSHQHVMVCVMAPITTSFAPCSSFLSPHTDKMQPNV